ncbi:MAG: tyrosine-type recombinase/integrase [Bacteroidetes bacterium]|nr:tyrosine-type recombinase/integrase [Bacteroidota bacterium]
MANKELSLIMLFEEFIKSSSKGKRLKPDGSRIRPQTVRNYEYVLKYLNEYEGRHGKKLRIRIFKSNDKRSFIAEKNYWKKFYLDFTQFLYQQKKCFDNYVGNVIKTIRIFFNYLNREKGIITGDFYKSFYVCKEEIPIVTLMPEQLQFLINEQSFTDRLNISLRKSKSIFVFGCTVALRVSDLFAIRFTDIEESQSGCYLVVKTQKTGTTIRIKLPAYAIDIINEFKQASKNRKTIFPPVPRTRFNNHLKEIASLAGWTNIIGKQRSKRGVAHTILTETQQKQYRFCDLVSSHTMRRTAITTMLMLGMKEHIVKKISGHANDSKSFYRYVNFVQPYLDNEMDRMFEKLVNVA